MENKSTPSKGGQTSGSQNSGGQSGNSQDNVAGTGFSSGGQKLTKGGDPPKETK